MRWITRWTVLTFSLSLAACADRATAPSALDAMEGSAALAAPKFWEANATANWHDLATSLAARRATNAVRMYTYLSLAQLRAGEAAEAVKPHSPTGSAIGAASARVLTSFFPLDATEIATALLSDYGSSTPIALYVIAAAVLTVIAVAAAKETRHRDLADVALPTGREADRATASAEEARTA